MTKELKIGEIFKDGKVRLEVQKADNRFNCERCYHDGVEECHERTKTCCAKFRKDHTSVIFVEKKSWWRRLFKN